MEKNNAKPYNMIGLDFGLQRTRQMQNRRRITNYKTWRLDLYPLDKTELWVNSLLNIYPEDELKN